MYTLVDDVHTHMYTQVDDVTTHMYTHVNNVKTHIYTKVDDMQTHVYIQVDNARSMLYTVGVPKFTQLVIYWAIRVYGSLENCSTFYVHFDHRNLNT